MKTRNAIYAALVLSGKYDLPEKLRISGFDAYGKPVTEEIPQIDTVRLERDLAAILASSEGAT